MADENKMALAKQVYQTLCEAMENRSWSFGKEEKDLIVHFGVNGENAEMRFVIIRPDGQRPLQA